MSEKIIFEKDAVITHSCHFLGETAVESLVANDEAAFVKGVNGQNALLGRSSARLDQYDPFCFLQRTFMVL